MTKEEQDRLHAIYFDRDHDSRINEMIRTKQIVGALALLDDLKDVYLTPETEGTKARFNYHLYKMICSYMNGDYENADTSFRAAVKIIPESMELWTNLGNAYVRMGHLREAETILKAVCQDAIDTGRLSHSRKLQKPFIKANSILTVLEILRGNYDEATAYARRHTDLTGEESHHSAQILHKQKRENFYGDSYNPAYSYGEMLKRIRPDIAITFWQNMLKEGYGDRRNALYHLALSLAHFDLGNTKQAISNINDSIQLNPCNGEAYTIRARIIIRDLPKQAYYANCAMQDFEEAVSRSKPMVAIWYKRKIMDAFNNAGLPAMAVKASHVAINLPIEEPVAVQKEQPPAPQ